MGFKYAIRSDRLHFLTHTIVDWIDLFTRRELAMVVVDSMNCCIANKGLEVYVWCLMPSHLHMIASVAPENDKGLSDVMRDFKGFTSKELLTKIDTEFEIRGEWVQKHFPTGSDTNQVWQEGMHPIELFTRKFTIQKVDYIHNNPVVAGIVDEAEHSLFSSARDYFGYRKGLVDISYIG